MSGTEETLAKAQELERERSKAEAPNSSERMFLCAAMQNPPPRVRDVASGLDPECLVGPRNRLIFEAVRLLASAGVQPTPIAVIAELTDRDRIALAGGEPYVLEVSGDHYDPESLAHWATAARGATITPIQVSRPERPRLHHDALHGPLGQMVRLVTPCTEADPVAVLAALLAMSGASIGRGAFFRVAGASKHHPNVWPIFLGVTSGGRKGTASAAAGDLFALAGPECAPPMLSGLSTGEGLIQAIRDPTYRDGVETEAGVEDKRLHIEESELGRLFKVAERQGSTLTSILRDAWDGKDLRTITKANPLAATGPHVTLVGHITPKELNRLLDSVDISNGFVNRLLLLHVEREQLLPEAPEFPWEALEPLGRQLRSAILWARTAGEIKRSEEARVAWRDGVYRRLTLGDGESPRRGRCGDACARAEAQVIRLSLLYALLDESFEITLPHLRAALALWDYAEATARLIFGAGTGDAVSDDVLRVIEEAGVEGITRSAISDAFGRHLSGPKLGRALESLVSDGFVYGHTITKKSAGRPAQRYFAAAARKAAA